MKKLYLKSALLLVLTLLFGFTSCKKDEFKNLSLSFSTSKVELDEGGYVSLKKYLVIQPSNLDTITLAWSSSDESVVTVTPRRGDAEAVSDGTATITVSAYGKSASIKVEVLPLAVTDFKVPGAIKDIYVNVPHRIEGIEITPGEVNPARISWSCKDGKESKVVFQYNQEEHLWYFTATEAGTYKVEATIDEFTVSSEFTVSVKPITSLKLSEESISLLSQGEERRTAELTYTLEPEDASYQEVEWSATPSGIINLDKGKITTIDGKEGTVTVTLKHKAKATGDKDIEATCKVVVTKTVAVESFTLSESEVTFDIGKTYTLKVKDFKPANGDVSKIHWKSDDWNVVSLHNVVGSSCTLESLGTETKTVYVTATAPNGYAQKVKVTVKKVPSTLTWDIKGKVIFFDNKTYKLPHAKVNKDATVQTIYYSVLSGAAGETQASEIGLDVLGPEVKITIPKMSSSNYKEYRLVAKCDNAVLTLPFVVAPSTFLKNNLRLNDNNTKLYGTYKKKFNVVSSTYFSNYNSVIRDSIWFSPEYHVYETLDSKIVYYPSKKYLTLEYTFEELSYPADEKDAVKITASLYDYARNVQNAEFTVNIRNSFLGYYYEKYDRNSSTPSKTGTMKAGETISINYSYTGYNYWMPLVKFYQIYYTDDNKTKGYQDDDAEVGGYSVPSRETRTVTKSIRTGETLYVKYKY
ncbi:MAG: Ig-like domain-containing protein [Paludibacteraceae bacterium]|nr:Ig-like domain-containing protein [Paludibacteraceae bacterium]